ncbi:hypothetical protein [Actinomadura luteofluorescens]|uniref:hypothetical protein n=1 Tax=Actinomadura luteofluorescens TaxID=46163 RepID=UPI003D935544
MSTNPVNEFAPYPRTVDEATAEAMVRHLAVTARYRMTASDRLVDCRTAEERTRYLDSVGLMIAEHSLAKTLRALIAHAPDHADEVARRVWTAWEDGAVIVEDLHSWLIGYGIDPERVDAAALNVMRDAA